MKILATFLWLVFSIGALAQSADFEEQSSAWDRLAAKAADSLATGTASDAYLDQVRKELAIDRVETQAVIDANTGKVAALKEQITALSATIPQGEIGNEDTRKRLATLKAELAILETPLVTAELAHSKSNALIAQVDDQIRKNFSKNLARRSAVPLAPYALGLAAAQLFEASITLQLDMVNIFTTPSSRAVFFNALPITIFLTLLALGIAFILPSRAMRIINDWHQNTMSKFSAMALVFASQTLEFICSMLGSILFFNALRSSHAFGLYGGRLVNYFEVLVLAFVLGKWLSTVNFHSLHESFTNRRKWSLAAMAVLVLGSWNIDQIAALFALGAESLSLINFITIMANGFLIGSVASRGYFANLFSALSFGSIPRLLLIGRHILFYGSFVAIGLAFIGYYSASRQLYHGVVLTFFIALLCMATFRVFHSLVLGLTRSSEKMEGEESSVEEKLVMWPVLLGTAILLLSLPLVALVWGARSTDLYEIWVKINSGLTIGDVRISAVNFVQIIFVFTVGYWVVKGIKRLLQNLILPRSNMDIGGQTAIVSLFGYAGYTVAAFLALNAGGVDLSNLTVVLGALSVGIGFGLQNIVSNFVSGIILLIERPIKKGDWISVSGHEGFVRNIAVRSTEIETFDYASVIVPNADLVSQPVMNWVHSSKIARVRAPIGVSYDSDPEVIEKLLLEVAKELKLALRIPAPTVFFVSFGESALNFELRFFIREADYMTQAHSEANFAMFKKLKENGVNIPFPQREITIKNPKPVGESDA